MRVLRGRSFIRSPLGSCDDADATPTHLGEARNRCLPSPIRSISTEVHRSSVWRRGGRGCSSYCYFSTRVPLCEAYWKAESPRQIRRSDEYGAFGFTTPMLLPLDVVPLHRALLSSKVARQDNIGIADGLGATANVTSFRRSPREHRLLYCHPSPKVLCRQAL